MNLQEAIRYIKAIEGSTKEGEPKKLVLIRRADWDMDRSLFLVGKDQPYVEGKLEGGEVFSTLYYFKVDDVLSDKWVVAETRTVHY